MFPNLPFSTRIWTLFWFTVLAVVLVLINFEWGMASDDRAMHSLHEQSLTKMHQIKRVADAYQLDMLGSAYRVQSQLMSWEAGAQAVEKGQNTVQTAWTAIMNAPLSISERELLKALERTKGRADIAAQQLHQALLSHDTEALAQLTGNGLLPVMDPLTRGLELFTDMQMASANRQMEQQRDERLWFRGRVYGLFTVGLLLTLLFGRLLLRDIQRAMENLVYVARGVQTAQRDLVLPHEPQADLREVMDALTTMRDDIATKQQTLQEREAEARAAEQRLQNIADSVPGVVFQFRLGADGSMQMPYVSRGALELIGVHPEEALQSVEAIFRQVHPDDMPGFVDAILVSAQRMAPFRHEVRGRHAVTGAEMWIYIQSSPQQQPEADGAIVWNGHFSDLTDQKLLQQELSEKTAQAKASEERLLRVADNIPGGVYEIEATPESFRYSFISRGSRAFGLDPETVTRDHMSVLDRTHPDDVEEVAGAVNRAIANREPFSQEYRMLAASGEYRWVLSTAVPLPHSSGVVHYYGYFLDVTERKSLLAELASATQQADEANRAKSTFLATMSHEIRTPMIGITGMLEILSHTKLDAEQRQHVDVIQQSAQALLQILGDILDFSKIEAGRLELSPTTISIASLTESVVQNFAPAASGKGLKLILEIEPALSAAHMADPVRIRQILSNFLSNALKFTARGGVTLRVKVLEDASDNQYLEFSVQDTGIGISPANQQKLFQPFSQAESSTTRRYGGTGLGLTICRRLALMMGGQISMESAEGAGTTMFLRVDLPVGDASRIEKPASSGAGLASRSLPSRAQAEAEGSLVLLAEDHPTNRLVLEKQFALAGFVVDMAMDGEEALQLWQQRRYAIVFTDLHMPRMDGLTLATRIRELERTQQRPRMPVLALTAAALKEEAERCLAVGMDAVLVKPVTVPILVEALRRWLPRLRWPEGNVPPAAPVAAAAVREAPKTEAQPEERTGTAFDARLLLELAGGDEATARMIFEDFSKSTRGDLDTMPELFENRESENLRRQAHRVKGAARMVGAAALGYVMGQIERAAKEPAWTELAQLLPKGEACYERLLKEARLALGEAA